MHTHTHTITGRLLLALRQKSNNIHTHIHTCIHTHTHNHRPVTACTTTKIEQHTYTHTYMHTHTHILTGRLLRALRQKSNNICGTTIPPSQGLQLRQRAPRSRHHKQNHRPANFGCIQHHRHGCCSIQQFRHRRCNIRTKVRDRRQRQCAHFFSLRICQTNGTPAVQAEATCCQYHFSSQGPVSYRFTRASGYQVWAETGHWRQRTENIRTACIVQGGSFCYSCGTCS